VSCWPGQTKAMRSYYDGVEGDQRDPHDSGRPVDSATLSELGVIAREQLQSVLACSRLTKS
jgi:hypothetical protein